MNSLMLPETLIHFTVSTADGWRAVLADEGEEMDWVPLHSEPGPIKAPVWLGDHCPAEEVPVPAWIRPWHGQCTNRWFIATASRRVPWPPEEAHAKAPRRKAKT